MDYNAPAEVNLPGDPETLRRVAVELRAAADGEGDRARTDSETARSTAAGGWHGPAGNAFGDACRHAQDRVREVVGYAPPMAAPLITVADALERARADYARVQQDWIHTVRALGPMLGNEPDFASWTDQRRAAEQAMDRIVAGALQANTAAADQLRSIAAGLDRPRSASQLLVTGVSSYLGAKLAGDEVQAANAGDEAGAIAARWVGRAIGPVASALTQTLDDTANPNYSVAERIGRGTTRALVNGVPAAVAGALGGAAGEAVAGPLGGLAAGFGAAAGTSELLSEFNPLQDDAIDAGGEVGDWIGDQF